jgi:hypothetical protein
MRVSGFPEEQMKDDGKEQRCGYVAGCTVWDRERSDEMRSQLGMRKLDKQMYERKTNWLQFRQRMPSERAPKQLLCYQPVGKPRRWLHVCGRNGLESSILSDDNDDDDDVTFPMFSLSPKKK